MERDIRVDLAGPAEGEAVRPLILQQFAEHAISVRPDQLAAAIEAVLTTDNLGFFLVAYEGGRAVGVAYVAFIWTVEHGGQSAWIEELYVVPELRNRGVGRALLRAALDRARNLGCSVIELEVEHAHRRAEHLYAREGFLRVTRSRWVRGLEKGEE